DLFELRGVLERPQPPRGGRATRRDPPARSGPPWRPDRSCDQRAERRHVSSRGRPPRRSVVRGSRQGPEDPLHLGRVRSTPPRPIHRTSPAPRRPLRKLKPLTTLCVDLESGSAAFFFEGLAPSPSRP